MPCVSSSQPAATSARTCRRPSPPCEGGRPVSWMFSSPTQPSRAEHRQRLRVLRLVAVVEADDDRLAARQRDAAPPVGLDLVLRHGVPAGGRERVHLGGELCGSDIQAGERSAGGRRRDHVVHQDRHGIGARPAGRDAAARRAGRLCAVGCGPLSSERAWRRRAMRRARRRSSCRRRSAARQRPTR